MVAILQTRMIEVTFNPFLIVGVNKISNASCHLSSVVIKQTVTSNSFAYKTTAWSILIAL